MKRVCDGCGHPFVKGESAHHDPEDGSVYHSYCWTDRDED